MSEIDEPIHLSEYQESWPAQFLIEKSRLISALVIPDENCQHVGSTAVPGMIAKPIIDIMLGLSDLDPTGRHAQIFVGLGYQAMGEAGVPDRLYFRRRGVTNINLHVVKFLGHHWSNNLSLRDFLRSEEKARDAYRKAKLAAVSAGAKTLLAYSTMKAPAVESLLREALSLSSARFLRSTR